MTPILPVLLRGVRKKIKQCRELLASFAQTLPFRKKIITFTFNREIEGRPLPEYVIKEFDAFLKYGIPAYGFIGLVCDTCKKEQITAFSCKKRSFCPSCCAKRQAEAATHLTENVLLMAPDRQFVVSFPIPIGNKTTILTVLEKN